MDTKKIVIVAVGVVAIGGAAFFGGMKYNQTLKVSQRAAGKFGNFPAGDRQQLGGRQMMGGGVVAGEIISKDDKSITVKLRDGGSKIVFLSEKTTVQKADLGLVSDLLVGEQITSNGTANADGSITAQSIQIRNNQPLPTTTPTTATK